MKLGNEDIHDSLQSVFDLFDRYCREQSCLYNIVCDEPEIQGYVLHDRKHAKGIYDYLQPVLRDKRVHLQTDDKRADGVLYTFTLQAIRDDHWKALPAYPKKAKREDLSILANPQDAKKVRAGKTIYQKSFKNRLDSSLKKVAPEDQYKHPTGKHRREQSAYRSSFKKSTTFSGMKEDVGAIAGSSIPPDINSDSIGNVGVPVPHLQSLLARLDERLTGVDGADPYGTIPSPDESNPATPVVPDDIVSQQQRDPTGGMQNPDMAQQALTIIPGTSPQVNGSEADASNANAGAHTNVRSSGHSGPNPQVTAQTLPNDQMFESVAVYRPEDGYDLMQKLISELGMTAEVRKVSLPSRSFIKACDGELRLEFDELPGKLTVYRHGKKVTELSVDLGKNTVVDEITDKVLKVMGS